MHDSVFEITPPSELEALDALNDQLDACIDQLDAGIDCIGELGAAFADGPDRPWSEA